MPFWKSATATRADRNLHTNTGAADPFGYPTSHQGWVDWYDYRLDAYHGNTYPVSLVKDLQLFRALDDNGKTIAFTRRLFRDIAFVVDVAVAALALDQVTLTRQADAPDEEVEIARRVWQRSKPALHGERWARILCATGDYGIEPVRFRKTPGPGSIGYGTKLVGHDPRTMFLEYDRATGTELKRVVVTHELVSDAQVDAYGNVVEVGALHIHQRTITAEEIAVTVNRQAGNGPEDEISGPHGLGTVPFVHLPCMPFMSPEHSLWIGHGMDRPLSEIDSLFSQISAIGDRFANPTLTVIGAKIGTDSDVNRFGRVLNIHGATPDVLKAVQVKYLEPSLAAVDKLGNRIDAMLSQIRTTMPEYLFSGSAAGLSGEALQMLATRYVSKYSAIRRRVYGGLEEAIGMAVAIEQRRFYDPDRHPVTITGPALLPADVAGMVKAIAEAAAAGIINPVDAVRHSQRIGMAADDVDAADYVAGMQAAAGPGEE